MSGGYKPKGDSIHTFGSYTIHLHKRGPSILYEVFQRGNPVSTGLDMTSFDERSALQGITDRLAGKKGNGR